MVNSQFQQRQVGVCVVGLVFALVGDIFLENGRRFRVVAIKAVENCVDVLRAIRAVVKCDSHGASCGGEVLLARTQCEDNLEN